MPKIVLEYHLIAEEYQDYNHIVVFNDFFIQQMQVINDYYSIINPNELLNTARNDYQILLTFDDGFYSFINNVCPVLLDFKFPCIIFPLVETLDGMTEHWMNEIHGLILQDRRYPYEFAYKSEFCDLNYKTTCFDDRKRLYDNLRIVLRKADIRERKQIIEILRNWAGECHPFVRERYKTMTWEQLVELSQNELVYIGAHTISHPLLTGMEYEDQYYEIAESKKYLENLTSCSIDYFSYPFSDMDNLSIDIVKKLGFKIAFTGGSQKGLIEHKPQNIYSVPRFSVPNLSSKQFREWLGEKFRNEN